ncbi:MAG: hypothetical protein M1343_02195 [Chloroflexi bacterium]|nr:hypothetical protein [Chloroflexota bacterium]MDA8189516.1 hypothetical protein [Dehalococcoidales bacterium]
MKKLIVGLAALTTLAVVILFTSLSSAEVAQAEPGKPKEPVPTYSPQAQGSPIEKRTDKSTSLPQMPASLHASGKEAQGGLEVVGMHFLLANPKYPNVTLQSTQPISLFLVPSGEMVAIQFASASGAVQTEVTIAGLASNTTYHKYEDSYHNHVAFTTDAAGEFRFVQDLSRPHFVFIQQRSSTIFLGNSGWSSPVGIWYPITRTGVLTQDIGETLQIDSPNITLDGSGHTIAGSGTGYGVYSGTRETRASRTSLHRETTRESPFCLPTTIPLPVAP